MKEIRKILTEGVENQVFSGASTAFGKFGEPLNVVAVGKTRSDEKGTAIYPNSFFDLASVTKVLFTTTVTARMIDRRLFKLKDPILSLLPELPWNIDWRGVLVSDVLSHSAGFEAWVDFRNAGEPGKPYTIKKILSQIAQMPPAYSRGSETRYSDLGFIILGAILENLTKKTLRQLLEEEVNRWLSKTSLLASPVPNEKLGLVAATENVPYRGGIIQGIVHDDNAWVMGGLAGHAGLFGTAEDCAKLGLLWLDAIERGNGFLEKGTANLFSKKVMIPKGEPRALGWMLPTSPGSSGGDMISPNSIGHLGYTGTSLWIDLKRKAVVVLLTNRVHPTSKNEKIKDFRPMFYDAIWEVM